MTITLKQRKQEEMQREQSSQILEISRQSQERREKIIQSTLEEIQAIMH